MLETLTLVVPCYNEANRFDAGRFQFQSSFAGAEQVGQRTLTPGVRLFEQRFHLAGLGQQRVGDSP